MVTGIEHIAIASPDPLKLARWYVDHLDFVINYQAPNSPTVFVRAPDRSMMEIIEATAPAPAPPAMRDPGLRHIAIAVTGLREVYARLQAAGVSFLTAPDNLGGVTVAFFRDCDGNILHLLERETPLP